MNLDATGVVSADTGGYSLDDTVALAVLVLQTADVSAFAVAVLDLLLPGYHHLAFHGCLRQTAVQGVHQPASLRDFDFDIE